MRRVGMLLAALVIGAVPFAVPTQASTAPWPWTNWQKHKDPVHERHRNGDNIASDPTVIADAAAGGFRMVYTGPNNDSTRSSLIGATSPDGIHWRDFTVNDGVVLEGRAGKWDAYLETSDLIKVGSTYLLFYAGYPREAQGSELAPPGEVGLATSTDGVHFARASDGPVVPRTPGGADSDALFSPSVVAVGNTLSMVYTGWHNNSAALHGATSTDGGRHWVKRPGGPLLQPSNTYAWMDNSVDEADVEIGPGGVYYLFFTAGSLHRVPQNSIGMARSFASPFGPWEVYPHPIVQQRRPWELEDMGFPTVVPAGNTARLWYAGLGIYHHETTAPGFQFRIGYVVSSPP